MTIQKRAIVDRWCWRSGAAPGAVGQRPDSWALVVLQRPAPIEGRSKRTISRRNPAGDRAAPFLDAPAAEGCATRLEVRSDYNSTRLRVTAAQPALVFVRDAYSRHWHATIDGSRAIIHPALGAFKAIPVPAGRSELQLRFSPPWVGMSLIAAYAAIVLLAASLLRRRRPDAKRSTAPEPR